MRLKEAGPNNISVVLLINRTNQMKQFSHELNCPNQFSGLNSSSETCDASNPAKYCDPLEGRNVYATLYPRKPTAENKTEIVHTNEKFILVSCRLDTATMFDGVGKCDL